MHQPVWLADNHNTLGACVVVYLEQHRQMDRAMTTRFSRGEVDVSTISAMLAAYKVSRCFPGSGEERFAPILAYLQGQQQPFLSPHDDAVGAVQALAQEMQRHFGRLNVGAASKLLWMLYPNEVVIFDSYALKALMRLEEGSSASPLKNYATFHSAWWTQYAALEEAIERATQTIAATLRSETDRQMLGTKWFRMRVFDRWLWNIGNKNRFQADRPS